MYIIVTGDTVQSKINIITKQDFETAVEDINAQISFVIAGQSILTTEMKEQEVSVVVTNKNYSLIQHINYIKGIFWGVDEDKKYEH